MIVSARLSFDRATFHAVIAYAIEADMPFIHEGHRWLAKSIRTDRHGRIIVEADCKGTA